MADVGVRELKTRLSHYLRKVRSGARLVVTDHGEPVAVMSPVSAGQLGERLEAMLRDGTAVWSGGKPSGARRPPRLKGPAISDTVIEDRG